ncbi:hypothetical protein K458DRAFT_27919 [Lentithecium fluviatile CBS 122367]|uniref:Uncharacterized protein n=1 Tax=Lentithecium fluviatile CBS 122367 TaxID=1168545 RepID=A0A6G1J3U4_9PLEO|nr:hypothetical protein K458DRAFT_27919 [Lentithecium fluviatile CBS 122367]
MPIPHSHRHCVSSNWYPIQGRFHQARVIAPRASPVFAKPEYVLPGHPPPVWLCYAACPPLVFFICYGDRSVRSGGMVVWGFVRYGRAGALRYGRSGREVTGSGNLDHLYLRNTFSSNNWQRSSGLFCAVVFSCRFRLAVGIETPSQQRRPRLRNDGNR